MTDNKNDKVVKSTKNKPTTSISKHNPNTSLNPLFDIDAIERFAESVKTSKLAKSFQKKDKDGNPLPVETADIVAAISLGMDMGLAPAAALSMGKKLNANSYFSVLRGRELGLGAISSMSKIYVIPTNNGDVITLDVGLITKCILDSGTEMHYIRDYEPTPLFADVKSGDILGHKYLFYNDDGTFKDDSFFILRKNTPAEDTQKANDEGKIIITKVGITYVTSLRLVRKSNNIDKVFHYSIQDAIDAELHEGFHSKHKDAKGNRIWISGRDNWNKNPQTMLRNRPTSIGGRIVAADLIQGGYSMDETMEILNVDTPEEVINLAEEV